MLQKCQLKHGDEIYIVNKPADSARSKLDLFSIQMKIVALCIKLVVKGGRGLEL